MRAPFVAVCLALVACGGPLPGGEAPAVAAHPTDTAAPSDAGASAFHAVTVTLCSKDVDGCGRARSPGGDVPYRVAFGSSVGTLRSREQAVADLYREVRDRTAGGARLVAETHRREAAVDGGARPAATALPARPTTDTPASDEVVDAARALIDAVDTEGEITLDAARGRRNCKLSLSSGSAARGRCLVSAPPRPGQAAEEGPRERDTFGKAASGN